jgi:NTP pyrophosphatase (non-canonical NTP hydrolase)
MSDQLKELTRLLLDFRDARDWKQFHGLKNLIISLQIEAAELLELTQWKTDEQCESIVSASKQAIAYELADIFSYLLLISEHCQIDLADSLKEKVELNEHRYPARKSRGTASKYDEL